MGIQREYIIYLLAFHVVSCVSCTGHCFPGGAYKTAGTVVCLWEAFQYNDYMRTKSLLQAFCVTQHLFLCLFTQRYFSGKPPRPSVLLQSSERQVTVPCGHCPEVPQCPFLTSAAWLCSSTCCSSPGAAHLGWEFCSFLPGLEEIWHFLYSGGRAQAWVGPSPVATRYRPQTGKGERSGWCRKMML